MRIEKTLLWERVELELCLGFLQETRGGRERSIFVADDTVFFNGEGNKKGKDI